MEEIGKGKVILRNPFMSFANLKTISEALVKEFKELPVEQVMEAARLGFEELNKARYDMQKKVKKFLPIWMKPESAALYLPDVLIILILKSIMEFRSLLPLMTLQY